MKKKIINCIELSETNKKYSSGSEYKDRLARHERGGGERGGGERKE